jgi:hypothetical protein
MKNILISNINHDKNINNQLFVKIPYQHLKNLKRYPIGMKFFNHLWF